MQWGCMLYHEMGLALSIKISQISLFTPTYFAVQVAVSLIYPELKLTVKENPLS